ncbi:MAG: 23S rRNA pseudouridine1911/1915/1917 synthase, partial [Marivirga sp.]
ALHAKSLGFIHPKTGKAVQFNSELPDDFQQLLEKWDNYIQHH